VKKAFTGGSRKCKQLKDALKDNDCPESSIECVCCTGTDKGYFDPNTKKIIICYNHQEEPRTVIETVAHELVHAYDDCMGVDWTNCDEWACSEIRAANLSGECARSWNYDECVKQKAAGALKTDERCREKAEQHVNKMFNQCRDDCRPTGFGGVNPPVFKRDKRKGSPTR